jgi:hypothetical protein
MALPQLGDGEVRVAPSVLLADFGGLAEAMGEVATATDWVHVDVMDGHFVPITIGPPVVASLRRLTGCVGVEDGRDLRRQRASCGAAEHADQRRKWAAIIRHLRPTDRGVAVIGCRIRQEVIDHSHSPPWHSEDEVPQ